jgi:hypothetical protein
MQMEKRLGLIGIASIILGTAASLLCLFGIYFFFFALLTGFIGMIVSSIYIFIDTRNEINTKRFTPGVLGLVLSSLPVILMLAVIIIRKFNS